MINTRKSIFETNSSSTHSLVMAIVSQFDAWEKGNIYYCNSCWGLPDKSKFNSGNFYSKEEVDAYYKEIGKERDSYTFCTYDEFCDTDELEIEEYSYTTPSGERVKAVAKYGYNG